MSLKCRPVRVVSILRTASARFDVTSKRAQSSANGAFSQTRVEWRGRLPLSVVEVAHGRIGATYGPSESRTHSPCFEKHGHGRNLSDPLLAERRRSCAMQGPVVNMAPGVKAAR